MILRDFDSDYNSVFMLQFNKINVTDYSRHILYYVYTFSFADFEFITVVIVTEPIKAIVIFGRVSGTVEDIN